MTLNQFHALADAIQALEVAAIVAEESISPGKTQEEADWYKRKAKSYRESAEILAQLIK
jgi:hypothetical protein